MSRIETEPDGAWQRVSDDLVAGLHHALNNRMAALSAAVQVLQVDLASDNPMREVLVRELERLRGTVDLLALLPRGRRGAEPVQLAHTVAELVELYRCHNLLRDLPLHVDGDPAVMPLWIEPSALSHALLMLLNAAGRAAQRREGAQLRLRYGGDERTVTVVVEALGGPRRGDQGGEERLPAVDPRAVERLLAEHGGSLEIQEDAQGLPCFRVRLPSLLEVRRREGRG